MNQNAIKFSSIYRGVIFRRDRGKFTCSVYANRKIIRFGLFTTELDAAIAYDDYIRKNKLNCRLNFPDPEPENLIPNTRLIRLTRGEFAIVDEEDFEMLNKFSWQLSVQGKNRYAKCSINTSGKIRHCTMHVFLCGKSGALIDHINRNGLHNYKSNFRYCNHSENTTNRRNKVGNTSDYFGVYYNKRSKVFTCSISKNKITYHLGSFASEVDAAIAHDLKAKELHGEFARLNFPEQI